MKLFHLVIGRLSLVMFLILTVWASFFYFAVMDEVTDEIDDELEEYAETLIKSYKAGESMPNRSSGSNNQYFFREVDQQYALSHPECSIKDEVVYIESMKDDEPARVLTTIFSIDNVRWAELKISTPTIEKEDLRHAILGWVVFLYVALLLTIILVNIWVFVRHTKPLYILLDWIQHFRLGKENKPLNNQTRISEFRQLNEAVMKTSERSSRLFEEQKQFIGNASHEIQTPIAICMNRIEMLLEDDQLPEKSLDELAKIWHTLENMSRTNKSLLLLTKIDNNQFVEEEDCDLNEIMARYLTDFEEVYAYRKIKVCLQKEEAFIVHMNESLAGILAANLLKNAFVHNNDGGAIHITTGSTSLSISNNGHSTALDKDLLFRRFYQGHKKEGSTGLGLAIAYSICKVSHLHLSYNYADGQHTFTLSV